MSMDFSVPGQVSITMANMIRDLLVGTEDVRKTTTPATEELFHVRDSKKLDETAAKVFHTKTAQALYLAKRPVSVRVYIDAAYGVHHRSGKSHTGCMVVVGKWCPVYWKSTKQKIVT
jgi:hypothetical protein